MKWLFNLLFTNSKDRKMCNNKVRFANEPAANEALRRINPSRRSGKPNRAYKCPKCRGYHLTKAPKQ